MSADPPPASAGADAGTPSPPGDGPAPGTVLAPGDGRADRAGPARGAGPAHGTHPMHGSEASGGAGPVRRARRRAVRRGPGDPDASVDRRSADDGDVGWQGGAAEGGADGNDERLLRDVPPHW